MALGLGNPPSILTPGRGPNGPGPIDSRRPETSVGWKSSVPYGPTNGYATPNGVTGFIGPAAGSLRKPTAWYVRTGGSNLNGGSSTSLTPDQSGTNANISSGSRALTLTDGNLTQAHVGSGICIRGFQQFFKIVAVADSTHCTVDRPALQAATTQVWNLGGAWADMRAPLGDSAIVTAGSGSGVQPGDTVYIGGGVYRAVISVFTSASFGFAFNGQVSIVGDVTGQYTGDAGMVQLTAYTTNDKTAPSATTLLNLNGKSNLAFSNIMFVGGSTTSTVTATTTVSQNITWRDCAFLAGSLGNQASFGSVTTLANRALHWLFDRCMFFAATNGNAISVIVPTSSLAEYAVDLLLENCQMIGGGSTSAFFVGISATGTLTFSGGGVIARNCTVTGQQGMTSTTALHLSTIFPSGFYDGVIYNGGQGTSLVAGTLGQLVEDYNILIGNGVRTNVAIGPHSISDGSYAPLLHFGQERIWGALPRMFGEPMAGSPLLGFGSDGAQTPYDLSNRQRPANNVSSGLPAVGALERHNTSAQATSPAPPSGTHIWQFTGPGDQEFLLPVSAVSDGFSIYVQRDANYSPGPSQTNPGFTITGLNPIGVTQQTIIDSGATGQWNLISAAAFTPTAEGWVTVRIFSQDGSGSSVVSFAVAAPS